MERWHQARGKKKGMIGNERGRERKERWQGEIKCIGSWRGKRMRK